MRFAAVQFDIAWEDKLANHRRVESMLEEADLPAGTFVVLPELGDTGFSFDLETIVDERTTTWAAEVARRLGIWIQPGFAARGPDGRGRNRAAIVSPAGSLVGTYDKLHPFSFGQESLHYDGGDRILLRRCGGAVVCPLVCYDLRFPELWRLALLEGAEVYTIGASWPEPRRAHWRKLLVARAIENQAFVVGVNRVGVDPSHRYAGGSLIVSPQGDVLADAGGEPGVISAELDLAAVRSWREAFPATRDVRRSLLGSIRVDKPMQPGVGTTPD